MMKTTIKTGVMAIAFGLMLPVAHAQTVTELYEMGVSLRSEQSVGGSFEYDKSKMTDMNASLANQNHEMRVNREMQMESRAKERSQRQSGREAMRELVESRHKARALQSVANKAIGN